MLGRNQAHFTVRHLPKHPARLVKEESYLYSLISPGMDMPKNWWWELSWIPSHPSTKSPSIPLTQNPKSPRARGYELVVGA
eukprot:1155207-Pelagomonas_calceolata.AAC.3